MTPIKRLVLDVLKPRDPNCLDFAKSIAEQGEHYRVSIKVIEVDDKTETTIVEIKGDNIHFEPLVDTSTSLGGSIHSIDEVEVHNQSGSTTT